MIDHFDSRAQSAARPTTRQSQPEQYILKNDPQCGLPAGGTNCDLDCERYGGVFKDPACLRDCLTPTCFALLIEDHATHRGVCAGSVGQTENNWPVSNTTCQMGEEPILDSENYYLGEFQFQVNVPTRQVIVEGLCRNETVQQLIQQKCMNDIFSLPFHLSNTILSLIRSMCRQRVYDIFSPSSCLLDCERTMTSEGAVLIHDYNCRSDCQYNCTELLYSDHLYAGGVCPGSNGDFRNWPVSSQPCQMVDGNYVNWDNVDAGLCGPDTEKALIQQHCINDLSAGNRRSARRMIFSLCRFAVYESFKYEPIPACTSDCIKTFSPGLCGSSTCGCPGCSSQEPCGSSVCGCPSCLSQGLCPGASCGCPRCTRYSGAVSPLYEDMECLSDCPATTTSTTLITSPNYPTNYPEYDFIVYYTISPPAGQSVDIEFSTFDVFRFCFNCACYDWVVVLNNEGEEILSKTCGNEIPGRITFTNVVTLVFHSYSEDGVGAGFQAVLSVPSQITQVELFPHPACREPCIDIRGDRGEWLGFEDINCLSGCPATFSTTKTINSPGYPDPYPVDLTVVYTMSALDTESVIDIEFSTFALFVESTESCFWDWIVILDNEGNELLPQTCGKNKPDKISFTNMATLIFHSTGFIDGTSKAGFSSVLSEEVRLSIIQWDNSGISRSMEGGNAKLNKKKSRFLPSDNLPSLKTILERTKYQIPNFLDMDQNRVRTLTSSLNTKLNPVEQIININHWSSVTKPVFEDSRGRYPWICSLRGRENKTHYCGATILSRPPGPLVIVTSAHCVHACKSETGHKVPNCCCQNVRGKRCLADARCGVNSSVEVMTGEDAEVICGEFETGGNFTAEESGEEFNIVLQIESISVHPNYNITRGVNNSQYVINDIATLHLREDLSETDISRLTPVCLPPSQSGKQFGLHAGWSAPPPPQFIKDFHPQFEPFTRDFHKMMHYNMTLLPCQDPKQFFDENGDTGINVTYQTDSYYPPGTICAREKNSEFCPTSGESGSPLIVPDQEGRFSALGVNSFLKGCSSFSWTDTALKQFSSNPLVYSRLSCFLPWIAEQYNMSFTAAEEEPECQQGVGNINEITTEVCRTTPTDVADIWLQLEAECIFPFTLDNVTHTQCTLSQLSGRGTIS